MSSSFSLICHAVIEVNQKLRRTEWPQVLVTVDRIHCTTKNNRFSKKFLLCFRGEERSRQEETERGWRQGFESERESKYQRIFETLCFRCNRFCQCRDTVQSLQTQLLTGFCFRHICGGLQGAGLISQKNANLNLVDFNASSHTSTLTAETSWMPMNHFRESQTGNSQLNASFKCFFYNSYNVKCDKNDVIS